MLWLRKLPALVQNEMKEVKGSSTIHSGRDNWGDNCLAGQPYFALLTWNLSKTHNTANEEQHVSTMLHKAKTKHKCLYYSSHYSGKTICCTTSESAQVAAALHKHCSRTVLLSKLQSLWPNSNILPRHHGITSTCLDLANQRCTLEIQCWRTTLNFCSVIALESRILHAFRIFLSHWIHMERPIFDLVH